jgi:thiosulfate/3-mercaptopyruvate sulfurtransferase
MKREDYPFITASQALRTERAVLLDARTDQAYRSGHLPGARRVPIESWHVPPMPTPDRDDGVAAWCAAIGELGIDRSAVVQIYDDGRLTEAARVWFVLQYFGVPQVRVIDAGLDALRAVGVTLDSTTTTTESKRFTPGPPGEVGWATSSDVSHLVELGSGLLDVRTDAEFHGRDVRTNRRGGHIPSARHVDHVDLARGATPVGSIDEIDSVLREAGINPNESLTIYCQSGARASLAAAILLRTGRRSLRVYFGSFGEWARSDACPLQAQIVKPTGVVRADTIVQ